MNTTSKQNIVRLAAGLVLAMATCAPVSAQLGGLKGIANKAKKAANKVENVKGTINQGLTTTTTSSNASSQSSGSTDTESIQAEYRAQHPKVMEKYNAEKAGGMDKYLGLDQTENGKILWKYANLTSDEYTSGQSIRNAFEAARQLTFILRYLKGNTEEFSAHAQPNYVLDMVNNQIPENLKIAKAGKGKTPVPASDVAAINSELARIKALYLSQTGTKEKTAGEKAAEANAEYVKNIVNQNYLLNDLTDRNRQAKAVADYKTKVNAKIKAALAPTKILGTYSTSPAWQGLPIFQMPELKEKYKSVQEMQFKTFYEKGGKYYVVKSAFRQSIPKGDEVHGAQPQKDYWPGVETPVEVPAEKIKEHFK